jgi:hypothetical protein
VGYQVLIMEACRILIFLNILLMHIIELVLLLKISETLLAESNAIISRPINQSINQT